MIFFAKREKREKRKANATREKREEQTLCERKDKSESEKKRIGLKICDYWAYS